MKQFISFEEAQNLVLAHLPLQPITTMPLGNALGCTLAESVASADNIPPFDNSAMDGFAVRAQDLSAPPVVLPVIEDIPAGSFPQREVMPGTCSRIMTGAPMPDGADAVAPVEWTEAVEGGTIRFNRAPTRGQHVRRAGKDVEAGQEVFTPGERITPPVMGMLAAVGKASVAVAVPPQVAIIATGDELVPPAATPGPGQIRNSNGAALAAQVQVAGGDVVGPLLARDNRASIEAVIDEALAADVLVFSGGVSVGDYDFVKQVLDERGMEMLFWKVRQRPGKPLAFGRLQGKPVFGLPGNPVSSAMCFEQYVRPALAQMLGRRDVRRPLYPAVLAAPTPKVEGLHYLARGHASFGDDGRLYVQDTGPQGSNIYSSVVQANCIFHMPPALVNPDAGTPVQVEWLTW